MTHYVIKTKPKRSDVYDTYWRFASKRFGIFENRLANRYGPWTDDPILRDNKFTNVFRASDRVSQFLIGIQNQGDNLEDVFFKTLLFKIFNKIETYRFIEKNVNKITYKNFSFKHYDELITQRFLEGNTIYSAAYIMPSAGSTFGYRFKHSNHLALLNKIKNDNLFFKISESKSLENVYEHLLSCPSFGSFLAFQFTIDLNYSEFLSFSEMDFVIAGPGAKNGILKCFKSLGDYSFEDIIKMMTDDQEEECSRIGMTSPSLWGRRLQLIDCQNVFCETDKYLRVTNPELNGNTGRTRIKQKFKDPKGKIDFFFPPKWNINQKIYSQCQKIKNEDIFL